MTPGLLPSTLQAALRAVKIVADDFSRYHKYTLGADLRTGSQGIVGPIIQANSAQDKASHWQGLRRWLEELRNDSDG